MPLATLPNGRMQMVITSAPVRRAGADKETGRKGIAPTALKAIVAEAGAEPGEA